jgi:hypothetical protein
MALENATQPGVEIPEAVEGAPVPTEREQTMAEITARVRQERDDEIKASGGDVIDTTSATVADPSAAPAPDQPGPAADDATPPAPPAADATPSTPPAGAAPIEDLVTIKVDGVMQQVSRDKIYEAGLRAVQKESSADRRLEEATRLLREVEQRIAPPPVQNTPPPQAWDEEIIAYALAHGTEEQKAEAVRQIRGGRQETATPDQIASTVESRILDKVDFQSSAAWFQETYKDIVSDPYLLQIASLQEDHMRANGDTRPRKELYAEIGNGLRKLRGGGAPVETLQEKRDLKASITNLPAASARRTTPQAPAPKTPSQIIEEMRTKRGQAA